MTNSCRSGPQLYHPPPLPFRDALWPERGCEGGGDFLNSCLDKRVQWDPFVTCRSCIAELQITNHFELPSALPRWGRMHMRSDGFNWILAFKALPGYVLYPAKHMILRDFDRILTRFEPDSPDSTKSVSLNTCLTA